MAETITDTGPLVRLSEIFPQATVITTDAAHFKIYRRFRDQPLPLIHPGK